MVFDNIRVSARILKIPILITGIMYALIGLGVLVNLFKNLSTPGTFASLFPVVVLCVLLIFVHYKAFYAVKFMDKIVLRSSAWSTLPNILSTAFLCIFIFVLLFIVANTLALVVFFTGLAIYIILILASLGSIFTREWFSFSYFTHYATGFWRFEHDSLSYLVPNEHDQTLVVILMVSLVLFIVPTLFSLFILGFKHLVLDAPFESQLK